MAQQRQRRIWFTSSTSTKLPIQGGTAAYTGLYQCQVNEQRCQNPETVANGRRRDGRYHYGLPLYNLQFAAVENSDEERRRYVYARTYVEEHKSFEIVRALIPEESTLSFDSSAAPSLHFQSFFQTQLQFDSNTCDFACCSNDPGHAYTLITPKTFVMAKNGDVFIAWDGFYRNCSSDTTNNKKKLQWTIGISKLDTSNSNCVLTTTTASTANFVECTEPVAIIYQSDHGRDLVMPHGGLAMLEVPGTQPSSLSQNRVFLLSVLKSSGEVGEGVVHNDLWAFPENVRYSEDPGRLQTLSTTAVHAVFLDEVVEDGGTIRVNNLPQENDSQLSMPFQLCRSLFNKGIQCLSLNWKQATGNVTLSEAPTEFLTPSQVQSFCKLQDAGKGKHRASHFEQLTTVATGFDVLWNDDNDSPDQVFFGCWGNEGGNGNFGSVTADGTLTQALEGAFPGSVRFLPSEWQTSETLQSQSNPASLFLVLVAISVVALVIPRAWKSRLHRHHSRGAPASAAYYELPTRDCRAQY